MAGECPQGSRSHVLQRLLEAGSAELQHLGWVDQRPRSLPRPLSGIPSSFQVEELKCDTEGQRPTNPDCGALRATDPANTARQ